jgi:uncharacterized membrane protein
LKLCNVFSVIVCIVIISAIILYPKIIRNKMPLLYDVISTPPSVFFSLVRMVESYR